MRIFIYTIILATISVILIGCKTKTVYVPVEKIKKEYINKYLRDSIVHYDSIFVKEKGDSVWIEKYKYVYRDKIRTDTIMKTDSIQVPYPVVEYKEVNKISGFQNFQIWCGRILILFLLCFFGYKLFIKKLL